jgi:UDP-N-acetylmuramate dehydrogenase
MEDRAAKRQDSLLMLPVQECRDRITAKYPDAADRLLMDEPMAAHSSFKVGGPADLVFLPCSADEAVFALQSAKCTGTPFTVLGNGSNILVSDKGIRGLTILLGEMFARISLEDNGMLSADAGALLSTVAKFAARSSLSGMEFAAGIPGSIGGAVYMNAGAYGGCMADIVTKTQGYDPVKDELFILETSEAHQFGYRKSFYEESGSVVLKVWLSLQTDHPEEIEKKMAEWMTKRKSTQPLEYPSAGSTFKRPDGHFAGRLIEQAGLKGCRVGGACVSPKHAGFIINDQKATAAEIMELIQRVGRRVYEDSGVTMDPEIRILGEW